MEAFMSANYPPFAVFPDLNCILRTPSGAEYRGKLRQHPSTEAAGEFWYEGYLRAEHKDNVTADTTLKDRFNRDGLRPEYFHADSNVEPLRVKLNRIPGAKRTDKNADTLVGEVWTHTRIVDRRLKPIRQREAASGRQYRPLAPRTGVWRQPHQAIPAGICGGS